MEIGDMTNCPGCGKIIERKDNFCRHCGQRNKCEKCGRNTLIKRSDHGTDFNHCTGCGHQSDFVQ